MGHVDHIQFFDDFHLKFLWIMAWTLPPNHTWPQASFYGTVVWLVLDGEKTIALDGQTYHIRKGDVVIIPPFTQRKVLKAADETAHFHYMTIGMHMKIATMNFVSLYQFPRVVHGADAAQFHGLHEASKRLLERTDAFLAQTGQDPVKLIPKHAREPLTHLNTDQTLELIAIQSLMYAWFNGFLKLMRPHLPDQPLQIDDRILKTSEYIKANLDRPMTISELARHVFLSESHLRLLFRKTFGISPMHFVQMARIDKARELLSGTSRTLKEIAAITGFQDQNQFSRTFKKIAGVNASEYRKNTKAQEG